MGTIFKYREFLLAAHKKYCKACVAEIVVKSRTCMILLRAMLLTTKILRDFITPQNCETLYREQDPYPQIEI